ELMAGRPAREYHCAHRAARSVGGSDEESNSGFNSCSRDRAFVVGINTNRCASTSTTEIVDSSTSVGRPSGPTGNMELLHVDTDRTTARTRGERILFRARSRGI